MLKNDLILAIKSPPGWGIRKIFSPGGGDFSEKILPHPRGFQLSPGGCRKELKLPLYRENIRNIQGKWPKSSIWPFWSPKMAFFMLIFHQEPRKAMSATFSDQFWRVISLKITFLKHGVEIFFPERPQIHFFNKILLWVRVEYKQRKFWSLCA